MKRIFTLLLLVLSGTSAQASITCKDTEIELNGDNVSFEFHGEYGIFNSLDLNGSGVTQTLFRCEQDRKGYHSCFVISDVTVITMVLVDRSTIAVTAVHPALQPLATVYDELECTGSL